MFGKLLSNNNNQHAKTSLVESFKYPKPSLGQFRDVTAAEVEKKGGKDMVEDLEHTVWVGLNNKKEDVLDYCILRSPLGSAELCLIKHYM